jgi:NAD(P)-dependent dehydrogenase (short-subunit alcohol dehydrogenase family)
MTAPKPVAHLAVATAELAETIDGHLRGTGWTVAADGAGPVEALVIEPAPPGRGKAPDAVATFLDLVAATVFPSRAGGGAAIVAIVSRDLLGSRADPRLAGQSGAVFAAARSLALELASAGITVNVVATASAAGPPGLLPAPASAAEVAGAVAFLLDRRSRYITGQLLFCDAGASTLSSMSV